MLDRGDLREGTLAEPGFEHSVSKFIITLSPGVTDKLEGKSDGIEGSKERTMFLQGQQGNRGEKYERMSKETFRGGKRGSWRCLPRRFCLSPCLPPPS